MVNGWHNMLRYLPKCGAGTTPDMNILTFRPLQASALKTWGQGWQCQENQVSGSRSLADLFSRRRSYNDERPLRGIGHKRRVRFFPAEHFAQGREAVRGLAARFILLNSYIYF
jgi:hypothetical protein